MLHALRDLVEAFSVPRESSDSAQLVWRSMVTFIRGLAGSPRMEHYNAE